MQEGILSLMQMPRTVIAVNSLAKSNLPFISVLTDPTTGGVSASFAMLGDIIIAEKDATIGFAGSRVIEETIKELDCQSLKDLGKVISNLKEKYPGQMDMREVADLAKKKLK